MNLHFIFIVGCLHKLTTNGCSHLFFVQLSWQSFVFNDLTDSTDVVYVLWNGICTGKQVTILCFFVLFFDIIVFFLPKDSPFRLFIEVRPEESNLQLMLIVVCVQWSCFIWLLLNNISTKILGFVNQIWFNVYWLWLLIESLLLFRIQICQQETNNLICSRHKKLRTSKCFHSVFIELSKKFLLKWYQFIVHSHWIDRQFSWNFIATRDYLKNQQLTATHRESQFDST